MARIATYTLRIEKAEDGIPLDRDQMHRGIQDAEDAVNDRLPAGYYCKIDEVRERES